LEALAAVAVKLPEHLSARQIVVPDFFLKLL
jgi:hypothetical protein